MNFCRFITRQGGLNGTWPDYASESSDDECIDAVSFGQDAQCLGEVADLPGVDHRNDVPGIDQMHDDTFLVSSGCFKNDQTRPGFGQAGQQSSGASGGVVVRF